MPAADQLERVLYVFAMAARAGGASFEELERALHCDVDVILKDLREATERVFHHPAGTADPFEIMIDADRVRVHAPADFKRPVRLSEREALALGLGLRVLAADADVQQRARILALAEQMESTLVTPHVQLQPSVVRSSDVTYPAEAVFEVAMGADDARADLTEAIEQGLLVEIEYVKPQGMPSQRTIEPRQLIYSNGHWYLAAIENDHQKVFRLDRILSYRVTDTHVAAQTVATSGSAYVGSQADTEARVRYSPGIARWIAEQNDAQLEADGSCVIVHRVSDVDWLVRHVLQYGGEAVVETPELRGAVASAAARLTA